MFLSRASELGPQTRSGQQISNNEAIGQEFARAGCKFAGKCPLVMKICESVEVKGDVT